MGNIPRVFQNATSPKFHGLMHGQCSIKARLHPYVRKERRAQGWEEETKKGKGIVPMITLTALPKGLLCSVEQNRRVGSEQLVMANLARA